MLNAERSSLNVWCIVQNARCSMLSGRGIIQNDECSMLSGRGIIGWGGRGWGGPIGAESFLVKFSIFYESMISRSEKESPIVLFSKSSVYV